MVIPPVILSMLLYLSSVEETYILHATRSEVRKTCGFYTLVCGVCVARRLCWEYGNHFKRYETFSLGGVGVGEYLDNEFQMVLSTLLKYEIFTSGSGKERWITTTVRTFFSSLHFTLFVYVDECARLLSRHDVV